MNKTLRGFLIILVAAFVWGIGNAVTGLTAAKYLLSGSLLPAIDISLANTIGGLLFLLSVLLIRDLFGGQHAAHGQCDTSFSYFNQTLLAGALKGVNTCCFVFSTTYIVATQSLVFESTYILWSVLFSIIYFRRRVPLKSTIGRAVLLGLGALLVSDTSHFSQHANLLGQAFGICAGLSYAGFLFVWAFVTDHLVSFRSKLASTLRLLANSALTIACVTEVITLTVDRRLWIPFTYAAPLDLVLQIANGVFVIGVVYTLVTMGMADLKGSREGAGVIAAFCLSFSIPFTLLPEFIVGKFIPTPLQFVGAALFMIGFVLVSATMAGSQETG